MYAVRTLINVRFCHFLGGTCQSADGGENSNKAHFVVWMKTVNFRQFGYNLLEVIL